MRYATREGTTQEWWGYEENVGSTLRFAPGETSKVVSVEVADDAHNEGRKTMLLVLSDPQGATIADGEGVGTITNDGTIPGRTVVDQVLDAVKARPVGAGAGPWGGAGRHRFSGGGGRKSAGWMLSR